jgi:hypothetical protein
MNVLHPPGPKALTASEPHDSLGKKIIRLAISKEQVASLLCPEDPGAEAPRVATMHGKA